MFPGPSDILIVLLCSPLHHLCGIFPRKFKEILPHFFAQRKTHNMRQKPFSSFYNFFSKRWKGKFSRNKEEMWRFLPLFAGKFNQLKNWEIMAFTHQGIGYFFLKDPFLFHFEIAEKFAVQKQNWLFQYRTDITKLCIDI